MISRRIKNLEVGDKIRILSFPRSDGADGFAGLEGVIDDIEFEDTFFIPGSWTYRKKVKGSIVLTCETSTFSGVGLERLKAIKIN